MSQVKTRLMSSGDMDTHSEGCKLLNASPLFEGLGILFRQLSLIKGSSQSRLLKVLLMVMVGHNGLSMML